MKTESILHVKGRSRTYSIPCGCQMWQEHSPFGSCSYEPCYAHAQAEMPFMRLAHRGTASKIERECGCELQYRGRQGGSSYIPCKRHRGDFFAELHRQGYMKMETKT